jgi:hypothetical protein
MDGADDERICSGYGEAFEGCIDLGCGGRSQEV